MESPLMQQGSAPLFSSSGSKSSTSSITVGSASNGSKKPENEAFSQVLADYKSDSGTLSETTSDAEVAESPDLADVNNPSSFALDAVDDLPQLGQGLPFAASGLSTITSQSFPAQALVSNLLPTQAGRTGTPLTLAANAGTDVNGELGLGERFLGAPEQTAGSAGQFKGTGLDGLKESSLSLSNEKGPASGMSSSLTALQAETSLLAAKNNQDPVTQSLQDLNFIEEGEKLEAESKLVLGERKQDEQILKLTKRQQAWGDALTERISMNAAKDIKQVTIHLDPPELGSLELKMQVKDDQQTQVQVVVQNHQVKEALESSAQRLRDMLANQGLNLSEFDVHTDSGQGQGGRQDAELDADGRLAQEGEADTDGLMTVGDEISLDINLPKNNNLLDTFA